MSKLFVKRVYPALPAISCSRPGCPDPAVCRPVLVVQTRRPPRNLAATGLAGGDVWAAAVAGPDQAVVRYVIAVQLCGHHRDGFRLRDYLRDSRSWDATWDAIERQMTQSGLAAPDRDRWKIEWEEATDAAGRTIEVA